MLILSILILHTLLRVINISHALWLDEWITIHTLSINIFKDPLLLSQTTNLPLYFYLFRLWHLLVKEIEVVNLRLFSVTISTILLLTWYKYFKDNKIILVFFTILLAVSPLQIYYSQELRPYILVELLLSFQFVFLVKYIYTKQNIFLYLLGVASTLGFLTHYSFHFPTIIISLIIVFLSKKYKDIKLISLGIFLITVSFSIFLYYTHVFSVKSSMKGVELQNQLFNSPSGMFIYLKSIPNKLKEVVSFYYWFGLHYFLVSSFIQFWFKKIILLSFVSIVYLSIKKIKDIELRLAIVVLLGSLLISICLEFIGIYPYGGRHIMPFSIYLYLIFAYGFKWIYSKYKIVAIALFLVLVSILLFHTTCESMLLPKDYESTVAHDKAYSVCVDRVF